MDLEYMQSFKKAVDRVSHSLHDQVKLDLYQMRRI
jgi:hypothetical protein